MAEQWGTIALSTTAKEKATFRTSWADLSWGNSLLDFWDDFSADGRLDEEFWRRGFADRFTGCSDHDSFERCPAGDISA